LIYLPGGLGGPFPGGPGGPGGFEDFIDEDDGALGGAVGWPGVGHFLAAAQNTNNIVKPKKKVKKN
jgi:hypothetical protein